MYSANQLYKQSGSTLPFKDWLEREKQKGKFIPNLAAQEEFFNANGEDNAIDSPKDTNIIGSVVSKNLMIAVVLGIGIYAIYKVVNK